MVPVLFKGISPSMKRILGIKIHELLPGAVILFDFITIIFAALLTQLFIAPLARPGDGTVAAVMTALLLYEILSHSNSYTIDHFSKARHSWIRSLMALAVALGLGTVLAFVTNAHTYFTPQWVMGWIGLSMLLVGVTRVLIARFLRRSMKKGGVSWNIAIVGSGPAAEHFIRKLNRKRYGFARVIGMFDDRGERAPKEVGGVSLLGTVDDLISFARKHEVDQVVLALSMDAHERLLQLITKLRVLPVDVRLCPDPAGFDLYKGGLAHIEGMPLLTLFEKPLSGWEILVKSLEDKVLASLMLLFAAPLMLFVALLVKLDSPGPVFFRQRRHGFNNEVFDAFKFRTMRLAETKEDGWRQATKNDVRITGIGKILRRTSLDELPQLINVLRGEMSLVGPRPHPVELNDQYASQINGYLARHCVKPGITGLAQVEGFRGETDTIEKMQGRVRHDLDYIDNWSLLLDIKIMLKTVFVGFVHKNAY